MPDQDHNQAINRRQFLKLGAISGVLASMPELAAASERSLIRQREPEVMQVGLCLPTQLHSQQAVQELLLGLQFASAQVVVPFRFKFQAPQTIDQILSSKPPATTWLSLGTPLGLQMLSESLPQQTIIAASLGEHFAVANPSPNLLINSFGMADAAWQSAVWASQQRGKRALILRSTTLSGYDCTWGFEQGLLAGGAQLIADWNITPQTNLAELTAKVASLNLDLVYLALNAVESQQWWQSFTQRSNALWITPNPTLEPTLAQRLRKQGLELAYAGGWNASTQQAFREAFSKAYGTEPSQHHALGYDTALLIASTTASTNASSYSGLRGTTNIDRFQTTNAPTYLHFLVSQKRQAAPISFAALDQAKVQQQLAAIRSGVTQPYI